jgi:hypothetical protein
MAVEFNLSRREEAMKIRMLLHTVVNGTDYFADEVVQVAREDALYLIGAGKAEEVVDAKPKAKDSK